MIYTPKHVNAPALPVSAHSTRVMRLAMLSVATLLLTACGSTKGLGSKTLLPDDPKPLPINCPVGASAEVEQLPIAPDSVFARPVFQALGREGSKWFMDLIAVAEENTARMTSVANQCRKK